MPLDIHAFKNAASTVSLIVMQNLDFLAVQRKHEPFKDKWALPGGFLNCDQESLEEAAIRELREETSLIVKPEDLYLFQVNSSPKRDPRGHVIDHIFIVKKYSGILKANDDAANVKFMRSIIVNYEQLAFDHAQVIADYIDYATLY